MKNNVWIASLAALLLTAGCVQKPAPAPDTSAADAENVRMQTAVFVDAWNSGDNDTLTDMIAEDAIELPQGQGTLSGREAIIAAISAGYDITQVQQTATVEEVFLIGEYANAWGTWRLEPIAPTGAEGEATTGKWMALYRRNAEGEWQIWRWMWNQTGGPPIPNA